MEKTNNDKGITNPMALLEFAEKQKKNDSFRIETDKMIVVFDADIYKNDVEAYDEVLNKADEYQDILAVTYPSFELFLLLHANNPKEILSINEKPILLNKTKSKNKTYIHGLCNQIFGFDVKSKGRVKVLSKDLLNAIKEEENIKKTMTKEELIKSENTGEKPPKANWVLAALGVIILGVAYSLAVSIKSPLTALLLAGSSRPPDERRGAKAAQTECNECLHLLILPPQSCRPGPLPGAADPRTTERPCEPGPVRRFP